MVSARKVEANRRNAQKSTGPRTAEGKARAARNSTIHGMFSRSLVAAGESKEELHALRDALIDHLRPQNVMELILVERIVSAQWKLVRLQAAEEVQFRVEAKTLRDELIEKVRYLGYALNSSRQYCRHKLHMTHDEVRRQRDSLLGAVEAERSVPRLLAASFGSSDSALHRMSVYEQRLERGISRALRELRQMREGIDDLSTLPPSPFANQLEDEPPEEASEDARENGRNEPTEPVAVPPPRVQASARPMVVKPIALAAQAIADRLASSISSSSAAQIAQKGPNPPPSTVSSTFPDRTWEPESSK